jgi:hypothetical protein
MEVLRQFVQKVVIGKTPGHQPATLEVHGRIGSILAAMEATTILEEQASVAAERPRLRGPARARDPSGR